MGLGCQGDNVREGTADDGIADSSGDSSGSDTSGATGSDDDGGTDDGGPVDVPHALGVIALGESHAASGGTAIPSVTASFIPDAALTGSVCGETISGCTVLTTPECGSGCDEDEYCGFDQGCSSTCMPICDATCDEGEVCYFPAPGTTGCKTIESFDAGAIAFSGTSVPITLFPPYEFVGEDSGSLFLGGAEITVQGSGAAAAGFEPFERSYVATNLLQTFLDDIERAEAYGSGPLPVDWAAGEHEITITVTASGSEGTSGTIVCTGDDSLGSFDVPRAVIDAAVDGEGLASVSVSVSRSRTTVHDDLKTTGTLSDVEVQPVAWLELRTLSTESHTIEGCPFGEAVCGDDCADLSSSEGHCGHCNNPCDGICQDGQCGPDGDSCVGICGGQAPGGCWCNDLCLQFDDCCTDFQQVCG